MPVKVEFQLFALVGNVSNDGAHPPAACHLGLAESRAALAGWGSGWLGMVVSAMGMGLVFHGTVEAFHANGLVVGH
jgi:hypothetical protein